ncbi:hypothetical protein ABPG72_016268 [Tetrahymena utriculariae]
MIDQLLLQPVKLSDEVLDTKCQISPKMQMIKLFQQHIQILRDVADLLMPNAQNFEHVTKHWKQLCATNCFLVQSTQQHSVITIGREASEGDTYRNKKNKNCFGTIVSGNFNFHLSSDKQGKIQIQMKFLLVDNQKEIQPQQNPMILTTSRAHQINPQQQQKQQLKSKKSKQMAQYQIKTQQQNN